MLIRLRYVTARKNRKDGSLRWYWQRKGHKVVRLPDAEGARMAMANRLNTMADAQDGGPVMLEGSIGWVVAKYKSSDDYKKLSRGTTKYYDRFISDIEEMGQETAWAAITRRDVIDFIETYTGKGQSRQCAAVFRNLFNVALYYGHATANFAADLRLAAPERRQEFWRAEDISNWFSAARDHPRGDALALAFRVMLYTAQRPGDVLAMSWTQYDGDVVSLRQEKTRKLVEVPCHRDLRAALDEARKATKSTIIVAHDGRGLSYPVFNRAFADISRKAGIEGLQARDLRRTAVVRMAEAGATETQIAAVTGHSIDATRQILETYLPRTVEMARGAIHKLETGTKV